MTAFAGSLLRLLRLLPPLLLPQLCHLGIGRLSLDVTTGVATLTAKDQARRLLEASELFQTQAAGTRRACSCLEEVRSEEAASCKALVHVVEVVVVACHTAGSRLEVVLCSAALHCLELQFLLQLAAEGVLYPVEIVFLTARDCFPSLDLVSLQS